MIENRRRMLMAQKKGGPIPSLKGDGKAFITLNDIVYTDRFEITFRFFERKSGSVIYAYQDDTHYWRLHYDNKGENSVYGVLTKWKWGGSSSPGYSGYNTEKITLSNRHTETWYLPIFYNEDDLTSKAAIIGTKITTYKYQYWKLFQDIAQVYRLKIWDGNTDTLKHDLIPYYMGEAGMLDLVDGTFYTNESEEGSFS